MCCVVYVDDDVAPSLWGILVTYKLLYLATTSTIECVIVCYGGEYDLVGSGVIVNTELSDPLKLEPGKWLGSYH